MTPPVEALIEIPPTPYYLALVRSFVATVARTELGLEADRIHDLMVVVSEAATNAIRAHQAAGSSNRIAIRCRVEDNDLVVDVVDQGRGFDPALEAALPDPTDPDRLRFESGLGVPLMRALSDRTEIMSDGAGTVVRLVIAGHERSA